MDLIDSLLAALRARDMVRFRLLFEEHFRASIERFQAALLAPLTDCETLICYQVALGLTAEKIGDNMGQCSSTVYTHSKHALSKLVGSTGGGGRRWLKTELRVYFAV